MFGPRTPEEGLRNVRVFESGAVVLQFVAVRVNYDWSPIDPAYTREDGSVIRVHRSGRTLIVEEFVGGDEKIEKSDESAAKTE